MNYQEAMTYLDEIKMAGYSMGLTGIQELCRRLGNPQNAIKFVHVAGTNGKGSVSAYITSVLYEAGYNVGTYSSPAVFENEEIIRFNKEPITKEDFADIVARVKCGADKMIQDGLRQPSLFEVQTAAAFLYFKDRQCDIAVLEAGLGGAEDATNVIDKPLLAVLTSISMDHTEYLGDTIAKIAENKSQIIKEGCHVVTAIQEPDALAVIEKRAENMKCKVHITEKAKFSDVEYGMPVQSFSYDKFKNMKIRLLGKYQTENAATALEAIKALQEKGYVISGEMVEKGLFNTSWTGRFSIINENPLFVIDGAHNADAAKRLAESIELYFNGKRIIYIMGILKDKDFDKIISTTAGYADSIITVETPTAQRTLKSGELAAAVRKYHKNVTEADSIENAVNMSLKLADKDDVIIAFGSLSYLGRLKNAVLTVCK